jgi:L-cysteine:1D-myo-inositol 2-amino-2-deoxy-alpha-D-glucopyranoside ligase
MYVCGIRPHATTHLGHAFTYAAAAVLIRYLEDQGYRACYVQNLTDVDDAILRAAHRVGKDWHELGNRWTAHFSHDMQRLNIRHTTARPVSPGRRRDRRHHRHRA